LLAKCGNGGAFAGDFSMAQFVQQKVGTVLSIIVVAKNQSVQTK
jgi:hypothetical protein